MLIVFIETIQYIIDLAKPGVGPATTILVPPPVIYICRPSSGPADHSKVRDSHCQQTEGTKPSERQKFCWDWKTFS